MGNFPIYNQITFDRNKKMDYLPILITEYLDLSIAPFRDAIGRIMRPIVRTMIGRGMVFSEACDLLKTIYIEACTRHFQLGAKKLTDSRISLLTGLQRKDVRTIRSRLEKDASKEPGAPTNPLSRIIAHWLAKAPYCEGAGLPRKLSRAAAQDGASFENLVAEISRDIHPRTIFDEMLRRGIVAHDANDDSVTLDATAFVPSQDETALLGYFSANLGDHAEAAADNLAKAPEPGRNFERAVHYNNLTADSLNELDELARQLQSGVLKELNAHALTLQERDAEKPDAVGRFRCGAFVFMEQETERMQDQP